MTRKQKNILNFLSLFFLLIVLPVAALYFLEEGVDYRKELMAELKDLGETPQFEGLNYKGDTIDNSRLKHNLVVVNFMEPNQQGKNGEKGEILKKLLTQFEDRQDVLLLNFIPQNENDSIQHYGLTDYIQSFELSDVNRCFFVQEKEGELEKLASEGFHFPFEPGDNVRENNLVAFCDTAQTIRRYYNILDEAESQLLVRHIIMFLPAGESRAGKYEIEKN
ncbi:MAG: hypothetical protein KDC85_00085 [Saprospiraceae bacterium]|nr:hypothetical protein [Saprospiraceae bacterium]MCB9325591.1 hypothetical protein [Lewinellaceae bacterium]